MDEQKGEGVIRYLGRKGPQVFRIGNLIRSISFGLVFMGVGVVVLLLFSATTSLHCERVQTNLINCTREQTWFGLYTRDRPDVNDLRGADLQVHVDDEDSDTYRVVLLTSSGTIPLTTAYSSGYSRKADIASSINDFVEDPTQQTMEVSSGTPVLGILLAFVFIAAGMAAIWVMVVRGGRPFGQKLPSAPYTASSEVQKTKDDFWD